MTDQRLTPAQLELLRALPASYAPERIDRLWVFNAHLTGSRETGLIVLSLFPETGPLNESDSGRHILLSVRYEATEVKGKRHIKQTSVEEGVAPPAKFDVVIAGVLARSGAEGDPYLISIGGVPAKWTEVVTRSDDSNLTGIIENHYR